jgi:thiamine transport system substrate-binding protein
MGLGEAHMKKLLMATAALGVALAACTGDDDEGGGTLRLLTHDSFAIDEGVIEEFEAEHDATVDLIQPGDAGAVVNTAILSKDNPPADVLFGIDNTFLGRALDEEIFLEYESPELDNVDDRFELSTFVTPIDYGYVNLNYDIGALQARDLEPPTTLEELTEPQWEGLMVTENPATSSPGLAFVAATVAYFGEDDDYDYIDYWTDLRANGLEVTDSWTDAYYTRFTRYDGDRPLVVSYTTSPACELIFGGIQEAVTGNVLPPQGSFEQIEFAGILRGTDQEDLARDFIDFMLSESFQEAFPDDMCVFPVRGGVPLPDAFEVAEPPEEPANVDFETVAERRDQWIEDWTAAVLR